jgi:uncharacterized membrane protein
VHQLAIRELKVSDIDGTVESQLSNLWLFNKPCQLEVTTTDTAIQTWHDLTTKKRKPWKQIHITVFLKTLTFSFTDLHYVKYRQLNYSGLWLGGRSQITKTTIKTKAVKTS